MSDSRFEWKVGLFVLVGITLIAALLLVFSRGMTLFRPTYDIYMKVAHVGGLRPKAQVMMSGIPIGHVVESTLTEDARAVRIRLRILDSYRIHGDAEFVIDSLGLLGDQYIAVRPRENKAPHLEPGDEVTGIEPFNFQEVARASLGFIHRLDSTAQRLNEAINRVNDMILDEETLGELAGVIANFSKASEQAVEAFGGVDKILKENSVPFGQSMSNLVHFSEQLTGLADGLGETLGENRGNINETINNFEAASYNLKLMIADVNEGKGVVGSLLKSEELNADLHDLIGNLTILSSNLNQHGLLYRPRQPRTQPAAPAFPGRR